MPNTGYKTSGQDIDDSFLTKDGLAQRNAKPGSLWITGTMKGYGVSTPGLNRSSPIQIIGPNDNGFKEWVQVSCGLNAAGIKDDGTLWTWSDGSNQSPTKVPATANPDYKWKKVAFGGTEYNSWPVYAIRSDGRLFELNSTPGLSPTQVSTQVVWKHISSGEKNSTGISNYGELYTWGSNNFGNLGRVDTSNNTPGLVGTSQDWKFSDMGIDHGAAIKTDGTLWTWGSNQLGELGTNDSTSNHRSSPVQTVAGGTWKFVSCGMVSTAAIKTDGTLWTWGYNDSGILGDGTTITRSSPTQIGSDTNWKQIDMAYVRAAAVKTDGTLWTWGLNGAGTLGHNTTISKSSPTQVGANTYWKQVSCSTHDSTLEGFINIISNGNDYIDTNAN